MRWHFVCQLLVPAVAGQSQSHPIHVKVDDGRGEESQHLAHEQAADDTDSERPLQFGARPIP